MEKVARKRITNKDVNWKVLRGAVAYAKTLKVSESSVPIIRKFRGHDI